MDGEGDGAQGPCLGGAGGGGQAARGCGMARRPSPPAAPPTRTCCGAAPSCSTPTFTASTASSHPSTSPCSTRTPRVPVASMYHRDDKIGPSNRQAKPDTNNGDEEGALAALALAEVCQRRLASDELSALDALHTLADISMNILQPSSIAESG
ncbi:hypothetical protein ZWY2020_032149 [Hordeum vulgare]|nr:hypothetical protein ZWY2020_032149 [Hordeum vulgare]